MNAGGRLALFGGGLIVAFAASYGVAAVVTAGPVDDPDRHSDIIQPSGGPHDSPGHSGGADDTAPPANPESGKAQ